MEIVRRGIVVFGLTLIFAAIILRFAIYEACIEERVVDVWDPITPSLLYPQNSTGWDFTASTKWKGVLKLNISASDFVRVVIGQLIDYNMHTKEIIWGIIIFNQTRKVFDHRIEISENVNFLAIINESVNPVNLCGNVKKIEYVNVILHPYSNFTVLIALLGLSLFIFGLVTKSRKRKKS